MRTRGRILGHVLWEFDYLALARDLLFALGNVQRGKRSHELGPDRWHPVFYQLLLERGAPGWRVRTEHELGKQARRVDVVLERIGVEPPDCEAQVLRGLWPRLSKTAVVELKSRKEPFLRHHLLRLFDYGVQYHEQNLDTLTGPGDLTLVLVVPRLTPSLAWAIEHMDGWRLESLGNGYARIPRSWHESSSRYPKKRGPSSVRRWPARERTDRR